MAKGKLTHRAVATLKNEAADAKKAVILWDTELRGFGASASSSGRVSWIFQHWIGGKGGKQKRLVFGHSSFMSLDDARKEAERLRGDVNKGIDVVDRKTQQRRDKLAALQAAKLGETVDLYLKRHAKPGSYWEEVKRKFDKEVIPALGRDTSVADISKAEVRALIDGKQDAGFNGSARYLFAVLRPFFKWCVGRDLLAKSPLADLQSPPPLEARDRILTDAEIKAFWTATLQLGPLWRPFYQLLLLTAQRREEVAGIRWNEIDLGECTWTIPGERTKNGKEHIVHLSPQAVASIKGIDRLDGTDLMFTTTRETPISGYGKAKARLHDAMQSALGDRKLPDWVVHDLRRTAASGMAKIGFQPHVVERVLNHVSGAQGGLVAVYQRYEYLEERKRAIEAWGIYLEGLIANEPPAANVVSLRALA